MKTLPSARIYRAISLGSSGEDVKALQQALPVWAMDGELIKADGIYGAITQESVKRFQKEMRFTTDGVVGRTTASALGLWCEIEKGIDCSSYQTFDYWIFSENNPDVKFAIIKATEGVGYVDPKFFNHSANLSAIGLDVSAYHFTYFKNDPALEAYSFLTAISKSKNVFSSLYLDLEYRGDYSGDFISEWVEEFMAVLSRNHSSCGIYTSSNYLREKSLQNEEFLSKYSLWAADWSKQPVVYPWSFWSVWQYSSKGQLIGVDGDIDLNYRVKV